jgi:hypothetical protein
MRVRSSLIVVLAAGLAVANLSAQAKPDLSGVWTLVLEKSDFSVLPPPTKQTRTITHKEPTLKVLTEQSAEGADTRVETTFTTDGKPQANSVQGTPMSTVGSWDGATLVLKSTLKAPQGDIAMEDRYSLADGGKTLTMVRSFTSAEGSATQKLTFTKK